MSGRKRRTLPVGWRSSRSTRWTSTAGSGTPRRARWGARARAGGGRVGRGADDQDLGAGRGLADLVLDDPAVAAELGPEDVRVDDQAARVGEDVVQAALHVGDQLVGRAAGARPVQEGHLVVDILLALKGGDSNYATWKVGS
ncbi:MAG: hypothetical protein ACJ75K_10490 [Actinomycetes bacterium]